MDKFNNILQEQIDQLNAKGPVETLLSAAYNVREIESSLNQHKDELQQASDALNAALALEVRKRMPKLQTNLADGKCHIRYRSKSLVVYPDAGSQRWVIEPSDFSRGFMKLYSDTLPLKNDLRSVAESVVEYFSTNYKTIANVSGNPTNINPSPIAPAGPAIKQKGISQPGTSYYA